ncbi:hypothetical protein A5651_07870 [Mycobacterium sp. 1274761.0]|nr:hypothetical protein A5651_07870 [Mycobacterium sp. 1274761.0]
MRTYGCQMNVHDSERLAGLLEAAGYQRATDERSREEAAVGVEVTRPMVVTGGNTALIERIHESGTSCAFPG